MAVEVGRVKKIIPTLNGIGSTSKCLRKRYPVIGSIKSFKNEAKNDNGMYFLNPVRDSEPPMERSASGRVTMDMSRRVLSIKIGKVWMVRENMIPARQPRIRGLEITERSTIFHFFLIAISSPEYQIRMDTAKRLMRGIANPMRMPR